jgi:hypothetical protein
VSDHVEPFYVDQAGLDGQRLAMLRHTIFGVTPPTPPTPHRPPPSEPTPGRVNFAQLRTAAMHDPLAFRAFWQVMGMLSRPDDIYSDPDVIARTLDTIRDHDATSLIAQPSRDELHAALATQTS